MAKILPTGTRVTVTYKGQPTQGWITTKSTAWEAQVNLLGLGSTVCRRYSWSQVSENQHRCFKVSETEDAFVITEVEPRNNHPMNWSCTDGTSREGAWATARAQGKPVTVVDREGNRKDLGRVFSPRVFEEFAYSGYVGYGRSMSDGYYAPIGFESWVISFRKSPDFYQNDTSARVQNALPLYMEALAAIGR